MFCNKSEEMQRRYLENTLSNKQLVLISILCTLTILKESINENGPIDNMPQGEYSILREHPLFIEKDYNMLNLAN